MRLAHEFPLGEHLLSLELLLRELLLGQLLRERAARLRESDLEGRALDLEERGAGLDRVALGIELLLEDPGDARADLHLARAFGASHRLEADRHFAQRRFHHSYGQRRRRRRSRLGRALSRVAFAAGGDGERCEHDEPAAHPLSPGW